MSISEWMFTIISERLGRLTLGDTSPPSPVQEEPRDEAAASAEMQAASSSSAVMGDQFAPQRADGLQCKSASPAYRGVPVAKHPPYQQIRCMTCNQSLEPEQGMLKCHVCSSWIHDTCIETLRIGENWRADMCLVCQQALTKQLKVISAQERRKARVFDPDDWFQNFKEIVAADVDYGTTNNMDLNEVEISLGRAIKSGLQTYQCARTSSTTDGEAAQPEGLREQPGVPAPIATAKGPFPGEPPQTAASSAPPADGPQAHRRDADQQPQQGTDQPFLSQRTGVRQERETHLSQNKGDEQPAHRVPSLHSARSDAREERMSALESAMSGMTDKFGRMEDKLSGLIQALQSGALGSSDLRGPPPKAQPEQVEVGDDKQPGDKRQTIPPQPTSNKVVYKAYPQASAEMTASPKPAVPSPAYQVPEDAIWNQSYLAKALQNMKDTDFAKLNFVPGASKPVEYEKWVGRMDTTTNAHHAEIGLYWKRIVECAQKSYEK